MSLTKKSKVIVIIALMLGMSLASLDTTIVGTALPTIVGKLGGINLYSWVFSAYLLTSTTTVPIYGKLADLYGRKPIFLVGSTLFLLGSIASGAAQSMEQLIIFRALQGVGAGAVLPMVLTIIGDIFSLEERARVQGLFSGVWALSSIVGPALGGVIVDQWSWRWVFYINVPFGLLSMALLTLNFKENVERKKRHLDYSGAATLTGGIVALLFALMQGGVTWAWNSLPSVGLFVMAGVLLALFLWIEYRAEEPILPLSLFKNRIITVSNIGGVILGVVMFGITSYVPLFVQGVLGGTATSAGVVLVPMLLAWPISATLSGRVVIKMGYRFTAILGTTLSGIGVLMIAFLNAGTSLPYVVVSMLFIGTGLGFASNAYILSIQNAVTWNLRGVATATQQFFRNMGGTIGVAVMGTILNSQMALLFAPIFTRFASESAKLPADVPHANVLLTPQVRNQLSPAFLGQLEGALSHSLFWVYMLMVVLAAGAFAAAFFFPAGPALQHQASAEGEKTEADAGSLAHVG